VGISFLAAWFISRHVKWALWPSALFLLLTWFSTVILGWHYVLDGIGGIIVVFICVQLSRRLLTVIRFKPEYPEINSEK
jgi:membrane-associated phospholipid phosphatase